jgi:hypothetical protein
VLEIVGRGVVVFVEVVEVLETESFYYKEKHSWGGSSQNCKFL